MEMDIDVIGMILYSIIRTICKYSVKGVIGIFKKDD